MSHQPRLKIVKVLTDGELYLSEIAKSIGVSRALAKVHLNKLKEAGIIVTKIVTLEDEARALRYYTLVDFQINLSPKTLKEEKMNGI